ncbi:MAG TPA: DNA polymerase III subunit beta [Candidatus Paceibacterota bacterium]
MKASFTQEDLERSLRILSGISIKQSLTPLLTNYLIECNEDGCTIRANNLNCALEVALPAKVEVSGSVCVDGGLLTALISKISKQSTITLDVQKGIMKVISPDVSVTLKIVSSEEFPSTPLPSDTFTFSLPVGQFSELLKMVEFAASSSDIKPEIAAVCLWRNETDETLVSVATDSFRLAELKKKINVPQGFPKILIPIKNVVDMVKILSNFTPEESCECGVSEHLLRVSLPKTTLMVRHIDGAFPDYQRIIPQETVSKVTCLKSDVEDILKLSSVVSNSVRKLTVSLNSEVGMVVKTENDEKGSIEGVIKGALEGEEYTFALNEQYLIEGISKIHSDVLIFTISPKKPLTIRGKDTPDFTYLIMPMQA